MFGKMFVPYMRKCLFQIAGFFNQPYLHNKSMKWPDFVHVDTSSHKLKLIKKFGGGHSQKWAWSV